MASATDQQQEQGGQGELAETKKRVPAAALCFSVGVFELAAASDGAQKNVPVKLVGRTGKPIAHWYWGNVVHDLAGMKIHKDRLPIDYCHYADEVIGYLDKFEISSGDLVATGALVPFKDGDRAAEVIFKSKEKVPYEASINFGGGALRLEEVQPGASTTVNGHAVHGPALIIREWTLRGIAVCPYGADMNTKTQLSAQQGEQLATASMVDVTIFTNKEKSMSQANATAATSSTTATAATAAKPADPAASEMTSPPAGETKPAEAAKLAEAPATPATPAPAAAKPGQEFVAAFGDVGARWFLEGKSFQDSASEFITTQKGRITELEAEVKNLKQQLAELPRGNEAASFQAAGDGAKKNGIRDAIRVPGRQQ